MQRLDIHMYVNFIFNLKAGFLVANSTVKGQDQHQWIWAIESPFSFLANVSFQLWQLFNKNQQAEAYTSTTTSK